MSYIGKIGRLPESIRDELNLRLSNGESGVSLIAWLNSLEAVQRLIAEQFDGKPITDGNLSQWTQRGYRHWLLQRDALAVARETIGAAKQLNVVSHGEFTDSLAAILTARYAALVADCGPEPDDEEGLARLRALCMDLMRLRRGDHSYRRVRIMEGASRGIPAAQVLDYFVRWTQQPQIKQWICDGETRFPKKLATLKALLRVGSRSDLESENPTLTPENPTKSE